MGAILDDAKVPVLLYNGQWDIMANFLGVEAAYLGFGPRMHFSLFCRSFGSLLLLLLLISSTSYLASYPG